MLKKKLSNIWSAMFPSHFTGMDYVVAFIFWVFIIGSVVNPLVGLLLGLV